MGPVRNLKSTGIMSSHNLSAQKYKRARVGTQELPMKISAIGTTKKNSMKSPTLKLYQDTLVDPSSFTAKTKMVLSVTNISSNHKHPNGSMIVSRPGYIGKGSGSPTPFPNQGSNPQSTASTSLGTSRNDTIKLGNKSLVTPSSHRVLGA